MRMNPLWSPCIVRLQIDSHRLAHIRWQRDCFSQLDRLAIYSCLACCCERWSGVVSTRLPEDFSDTTGSLRHLAICSEIARGSLTIVALLRPRPSVMPFARPKRHRRPARIAITSRDDSGDLQGVCPSPRGYACLRNW